MFEYIDYMPYNSISQLYKEWYLKLIIREDFCVNQHGVAEYVFKQKLLQESEVSW